MNVILPRTGYYWVGTLTDTGLDALKVTDKLRCACGGTKKNPCDHTRAVESYRRLEGTPMSEVKPSVVTLPDCCPVCAAPVIPRADHWRCTASPGHYWQYRGEQGGVKAFLTQPHPAKQGAFYEQSIEEREAFLEQARRQLYANGYSPYR